MNIISCELMGLHFVHRAGVQPEPRFSTRVVKGDDLHFHLWALLTMERNSPFAGFGYPELVN